MKIVIVTEASQGMRPVPYGTNSGLNPIAKSNAAVLRDQLRQRLRHSGCTVEIASETEDLQALLNQGVQLLLISPFVRDVCLDTLPPECYYQLSELDYLSGNITGVLARLGTAAR